MEVISFVNYKQRKCLKHFMMQKTSTAYEKFMNGLVNIDDVCSFKIKEIPYSDAVEILRLDMS